MCIRDSHPSERAIMWISLGPMRIPMVSPGVQARVEWIDVYKRQGYVTAQITDADPSAYGFDAPLATVRAASADGTVTLHYAENADGCWMMVEGDSSCLLYTSCTTTSRAFL